MRHVRALVFLCLLAVPAEGQQVADSTFDARVAHPAYGADGPRVLFDEAHHNFHTSGGRYRAFADLIRNDGYRVTPNRTAFTTPALAGFEVVVISNALGAEEMRDTAASHPAFSEQEREAVCRWVNAGGALLFIADHAPMGDAARRLAERFGVDMRSAFTIDTSCAVNGNAGLILFDASGGLDTAHAIIRGRASDERVRRVITFTGQSLGSPPGSASLLTLSPNAEDLMVGPGARSRAVSPDQRKSAAGRSQALAFGVGRGRVVVLGEAAMLSAQLAGPPGGPRFQMGMNFPGIDNRQLALNIMHWLTREIR